MRFTPLISPKKACKQFLRQRTAVCIALMIGTTGAWAYVTDELSAINALVAQQTADITRHRTAVVVGQIRAAMPALSSEQAFQLASALLDDPARFQAFLSLDDSGRTKLFEGFAARLQGSTLTTEHFDSFIAQIKDASSLRDLGVDSVRDLSSPEAERLVQSPKSEQLSTEALMAILRDLDELTEDLMIEEEDNSNAYQGAKSHIDGQALKNKTSAPSTLYKDVQDLKAALATATTDEDRKNVRKAIVALQAKTEIWMATLGSNLVPGTGTEHFTPARKNLSAINDLVIRGIQNVIRTPAIRCVTAYDPDFHMVVTRCN